MLSPSVHHVESDCEYLNAAPFEKAFVRRVLSDVRGVALLCRIHVNPLEKLAGRSFVMDASSLLTAACRGHRRHVAML
jgi:hypothetical protein